MIRNLIIGCRANLLIINKDKPGMTFIMLDEALKKLIERNACALSTVSVDGKPHAIAVAYVRVVNDNQLLITDNYMVETRTNIKANPRVALVTWNKNWEEDRLGVSIEGRAEYFDESRWLDEVKQIPENKDEPCKGAVLVTIEKIKKI